MSDVKKNKAYPVGIQTFSEVIEGGYTYVDKTAYVYRLVSEGKYYFLSRPRRFGKSLLISTLEAYYSGQRHLFQGLALDTLTDDWEPHPILHLDLNADEYDSDDSLAIVLDLQLREWEAQYGITPLPEATLSYRFGTVITTACRHTGKRVVILIDEYDKPMLNAIENEPLADRYRSTLKSFYSNLKKKDRYIEFAFLTGVARFSKLSIFSDLNNLRDISFEPSYSAICGITEYELEQYFRPGLENMSHTNGQSYSDIHSEIKRRYDGYHFSKELIDIYNPFSICSAFAANVIDNYWSKSGTPSYLVSIIKAGRWQLRDIEHYTIDADMLSTEGILTRELIPSLYQAGYLTIKDYDRTYNNYILGYPNQEVEESFIKFLMPLFLGSAASENEFLVKHFVEDVVHGRPVDFMTRLGSLLRSVPHLGKADTKERNFQNAIYLLFKMVGFYTTMENHTSDGRIDLTVETGRFVYIFEFKVDKSAEVAMTQIHEKEYWKKFEASGKTIFLIGANFNRSKRALDPIEVEELQPDF